MPAADLTQPDASRTTRAVTFIPVACVLGSIVSLQVGSGYATTLFDRVGAIGAVTLRITLGALIMLAVARPRMWRWTAQQWRAVVPFGLVLGLMNTAFYLALEQIPFGITLAIEFLGPLGLAAVLSRRFSDALWVALALAGVLYIGVHNSGSGTLTVLGVVFAATAALCWAAYIVLGARLASVMRGQDGLAGGLLVAAIGILPIGLVQAAEAMLVWPMLGAGLVVAVLSSALPYGLEIHALRTMPKKTFAILLALEPAVGVLIGAIMLHQHLDVWTILAIGLVVIAGIGATLSLPRRLQPRADKVSDTVLT